MNAPTTLKLGEVPAFLEKKYGVKVSRQSVYNWTKIGRRNATLRVSKLPGGIITTTDEWISTFFYQAGVDVRPI